MTLGSDSMIRARGPVVYALGICALCSGAALLASVFLHASLGVTLTILGVFAVAVAAFTWLRVPWQARASLRTRAIVGALAGIVATAAYDAVRFAIVAIFHLHVQPYAALPVFGKLILGVETAPGAAFAAGLTYHELNGMLFGIAYAFIVGARGWISGIAWGLGLELLMLLVYPGFLHIKALLAEFTFMSLCGHVAYGFVLGSGVARFSGNSR